MHINLVPLKKNWVAFTMVADNVRSMSFSIPRICNTSGNVTMQCPHSQRRDVLSACISKKNQQFAISLIFLQETMLLENSPSLLLRGLGKKRKSKFRFQDSRFEQRPLLLTRYNVTFANKTASQKKLYFRLEN